MTSKFRFRRSTTAIDILALSWLPVRWGFDYQQTLVADPHLSSHGISSDAARAYWDGVEARVRQVPGVTNVAVRAIARQFTAPVVCGAVAGSALAAGVGMILSRELFGVSGLDPVAHVGALVSFALVAAAAAAPSLRRALRVDPITVLRHE